LKNSNRGKSNLVKRGLAVILILVVLSSAGCWDQNEILDLALVVAIGIDKGRNPEEQVILTIQVANSRAIIPGDGGGGGAAEAFWTVTGRGRTGRQATYQLSHRVPRIIFFGHNRVFIIGEDAARSGMIPYLDRINRSQQSRPSMYLAIARGTAQNVLETRMPTFQSSGLALVNLFELGNRHNIYPVRLYEFNYNLNTGTTSAVAPIVAVARQTSVSEAEGSQSAKALVVKNLAVFDHEGRMIGELEEVETLGFLWVRNGFTSRELIVSCPVAGPQEPVALELRHSKSRTVVESGRNGLPRFRIQVESEFDLAEHFGDHAGMNNPLYLDSLEKRANTQVVKEIDAVIRKARELNADVLGLGEEVRRQRPDLWPALKMNWPDVFPMVEIVAESKSVIRSRGLTVESAGTVQEH